MTAHAAMENTFFEDFSVQKMLTIIITTARHSQYLPFKIRKI